MFGHSAPAWILVDETEGGGGLTGIIGTENSTTGIHPGKDSPFLPE